MLINRITVTIEPKIYGGGIETIKITTDAMGQRFAITEPLEPDDLTSRLEYFFERAMQMTRDALKKAEQKESPEGVTAQNAPVVLTAAEKPLPVYGLSIEERRKHDEGWANYNQILNHEDDAPA